MTCCGVTAYDPEESHAVAAAGILSNPAFRRPRNFDRHSIALGLWRRRHLEPPVTRAL
jgi:hypothetical protein